MRLTEICLITDDVPALAGFYAKITGAQAEGDHVHTTLHTEGAVIALFSMEGMEAMATGMKPAFKTAEMVKESDKVVSF